MSWNRSEAASTGANVARKARARMPGWLAYAAGGAIVAGGVAAWVLTRPEPKKTVEKNKSEATQIAEVAPAVTNAPPKRRTVAEIIRSRGGRKNLTAADKAEIAEIMREKMASRGLPPAPPAPAPRTKRIFECHSDQIIALVVTGGDSIPPFPGTEEQLEKEFVRSLNIPIVINDDDSEDLKRTKQAVIDARAAIDGEMKKGRGFREVLEEYRKQVNDNTAMRREVKAKAGEIMREEGVDAAEQYVEKANEKLKDWGIEGVDRPRTREEILADRQERQLQRLQQQQQKQQQQNNNIKPQETPKP